MYDWDEYLTVAPQWMCEECGDMAINLMEQGYCFYLGEGIKSQWLDYLWDADPSNPVFAE